MLKKIRSLLTVGLLSLVPFLSYGQSDVVQDYSKLLTIPNIKAIEASSSHLYVLSESEGMAVFRTYADSLQWLYTSSGMQRRGNQIEADIRFAYLYGDSKRLTILEPTSVLGVYSSTLLPSKPLGVARLQNNLFVALGSDGLGSLSLETPESVDSEAEIIGHDAIGRADVLDVASSIISNQLFVLTNDLKIHVFVPSDNGIQLSSSVTLSNQIHKIFLDEELIFGAVNNGEILEVNANGLGKSLGSIGEEASKLVSWRNHIFVRGKSGKISISTNSRPFELWKSDTSAGNHISKSSSVTWLSIYNKLGPLKMGTEQVQNNTPQVTSSALKIVPIVDIILTFPKPLLLGIDLADNYPADDVELTYRSNVTNASIRKQGLFWRPGTNNIGYNWFTIIATNSKGETDSTRFSVDVRTFNAPPRFSPVRGSSIAMNDTYELKFNAIDPENPSSKLIRYLGVDLPEGATLNERTGLFRWTPSERQVGESTFRVIATDEQGAATSQDITLKVLDISREGQ